ncbi:MAG: aminoacyl-tRNA hydrolase [Chitinophagaceae bacterium]|nr:aminoacyl-tRNA hydrolase [Chitinophagaceae bacterium]
MSKFLLVGLGNIGPEYANTRHNIGFDVLNVFVMKHKGSFAVDRLAYMAEVKFKGKNIVCICPTTYMNLSGRAFKYWMDKTKVPLENTLTVVDDIALPLDRIRIRPSGSAGGHNGLKDIQNILGTDVYPKLRFGIGNQYPKGMQADFVLGKWRKEEEPQVRLKIETTVGAIECFVTAGIEQAMTLYNNMSIKL